MAYSAAVIEEPAESTADDAHALESLERGVWPDTTTEPSQSNKPQPPATAHAGPARNPARAAPPRRRWRRTLTPFDRAMTRLDAVKRRYQRLAHLQRRNFKRVRARLRSHVLRVENNTRLVELYARRAEVEAQRDEIHARFDESFARRDQINARLEEVIARRDEVNARIDEVIARPDAFNGRFDEDIARRDEINAQVEEIIAWRDEVNARLVELVAGCLEVSRLWLDLEVNSLPLL